MPVSRTKLKCIYCNKGLSSRKGDHIPPKSFFPEKPGHSLMQVPCCQECNRKYSVSDEKVRELIAVMDGVNDHPVVKAEILPAVFRGWEKAEGRLYRFMNEVIDWSSLPQDLPSFKSFQEMPISLRTRPELTDFCGRMARALLYEQHKVRTDAKTKFKWGFADFMHPDDIVYLTSIKPPRVYGDEVFSYCVHVNPLNLVAICWVQFYKPAFQAHGAGGLH